MPKNHVQKVICYVTRKDQLLVFRHVDYSYEQVGIQVPAGTVRIDETPKQAAIREVTEETNLVFTEPPVFLGTANFDITPTRFEIQHRHFFHFHYTGDTLERWPTQELHDGLREPTNFECFWIPLKDAHVLQSGQSALLHTLFSSSNQ